MPLVVPEILPWTFFVTDEEEACAVQELGILVVGFQPNPPTQSSPKSSTSGSETSWIPPNTVHRGNNHGLHTQLQQ